MIPQVKIYFSLTHLHLSHWCIAQRRIASRNHLDLVRYCSNAFRFRRHVYVQSFDPLLHERIACLDVYFFPTKPEFAHLEAVSRVATSIDRKSVPKSRVHMSGIAMGGNLGWTLGGTGRRVSAEIFLKIVPPKLQNLGGTYCAGGYALQVYIVHLSKFLWDYYYVLELPLTN